MFSEEDLFIIKRDCFKISILTGSIAELQSQNGDWWIILETQDSLSRRKRQEGAIGRTFYRLMHRHADDDTYHDHAEFFVLLDAVLEILDHDDYKLKHRGKTQYNELLEQIQR